MVKIDDKMKEVLSKTRIISFATSSKDGTPNVVPIGMFTLQPDDETIWVVDNFMKKTLENIKENPKAAFFIWNPEYSDSYQIKGSIKIENSGEDYEKAVGIAHKRMENAPAKNLLKMTVTDIYSVTAGPNAGKRL